MSIAKKWKRRRRRQAVVGDIRLAPQEPGGAGSADGAPQTVAPSLPVGLSEVKDSPEGVWPDRVVLVIVALALLFIAVVAWLIAHEPARETKTSALLTRTQFEA